RRRHTRSKRDWSSDVCSSDLTIGAEGINVTAINLTGTGYWRISLWRDDHQFLAVYRYPVDGSMVNGPINKRRIQFSLQYTIQHRSEERRVGKECTSRLQLD